MRKNTFSKKMAFVGFALFGGIGGGLLGGGKLLAEEGVVQADMAATANKAPDAVHDAQIYDTIGNWRLWRNDAYCGMSARDDHGNEFSLIYDWNQLVIWLSNEGWDYPDATQVRLLFGIAVSKFSRGSVVMHQTKAPHILGVTLELDKPKVALFYEGFKSGYTLYLGDDQGKKIGAISLDGSLKAGAEVEACYWAHFG